MCVWQYRDAYTLRAGSNRCLSASASWPSGLGASSRIAGDRGF